MHEHRHLSRLLLTLGRSTTLAIACHGFEVGSDLDLNQSRGIKSQALYAGRPSPISPSQGLKHHDDWRTQRWCTRRGVEAPPRIRVSRLRSDIQVKGVIPSTGPGQGLGTATRQGRGHQCMVFHHVYIGGGVVFYHVSIEGE